VIFNTWLFAAFGVAVLLVYWFLTPARMRPFVLIVAGLLFYATAIPAYTVLIVALAAVTYVTAQGMLRAQPGSARRAWLIAGVIASVGVLIFFKYSKLFALSFGSICQGGCLRFLPDIAVPLAVSFFTFEFVHLLVDVYVGKIERVRLRDFALFALFFPTMVAGPIKRYQNFVPQVDLVRPLSGLVAVTAIARIFVGLAKKMIVADSMNPLVVPLGTPSPLYNAADYWIATLAYAVKIYFDFSGYSDIAIGFSALLGFQILENFDRPYRATDISQFWRRWHISLSSWIRDYLFIPLGGSRGHDLRVALNLGAVMAIAGLWHGAAWHFVLWGLWHGAGLALHRAWSALRLRLHPSSLGAWYRYASIGLTFAFVALGWVLFASPTAGTALAVYAGLLGAHLQVASS
jgi:alginate O-acetyltransferase complex protein AlgI